MIKKVLAGECFNSIHPGHTYFLQEIAKLGDELIIVLTHKNSVNSVFNKKSNPSSNPAKSGNYRVRKFMKSATELLLDKTYEEIWYRGEEYANGGKVNMVKGDDREVQAVVKGTEQYIVNLKFSGAGISRSCTCPYNAGNPRSRICKHIVATAILWDEMRGIERPNKDEIESYTIAPSLVSRSQIDALYKNPLKADLELLRILADETALGGKPRPHVRLPNLPHFNTDKDESLTLQEARKVFREIERWTNHRAYDRYFCAGEMVAAFCEVMRIIKKRLAVTNPLLNAEILRESQKFHYKLIIELIDDSEGLHEFTEAHLEDIYQTLKKFNVPKKEKIIFEQKLQEFDEYRDDY